MQLHQRKQEQEREQHHQHKQQQEQQREQQQRDQGERSSSSRGSSISSSSSSSCCSQSLSCICSCFSVSSSGISNISRSQVPGTANMKWLQMTGLNHLGTEASGAAQSRVGQELGRRWQPIVPTLALRPCRLSLLFSPLENICSFALWWHHVVCNCVHIFLGPASLSISPQTLFYQYSTQKNSTKASKTRATLSGTAKDWNARAGSRPTTPASSFSSSVNFKGTTGRSIDEWLQKRKKNELLVGSCRTKQVHTPRDVSSSVSQQRQLQMRQHLHLEETIALKSKQVIYHTVVVMHF